MSNTIPTYQAALAVPWKKLSWGTDITSSPQEPAQSSWHITVPQWLFSFAWKPEDVPPPLAAFKEPPPPEPSCV